MGALHVLGQVAPLHGRIAADVALVVEQTGMGAQMLGQVVAHAEPLVAVLAKVFRLLGVHDQVALQVAAEFELLRAELAARAGRRWLGGRRRGGGAGGSGCWCRRVVQSLPVRIQTGVRFERLGTRSAREPPLRLVDAPNVIGHGAFAHKRSVAQRTAKVALLSVHGQHMVAQAAAIGKRLGTLVAGEWSGSCGRWGGIYAMGLDRWSAVVGGVGRLAEHRLGVLDGQRMSGHVDNQIESVDVLVAHVAVEYLVAVCVAQVLDETLLGVQSLFTEGARVLVTESATALVDVSGGRRRQF